MQVTQFRAEVYAEGFSEQRAFSIDASGKAFKGLIDGIYSRKIEAIIRELSTNAFDAQIDAAYIGPFETHLPTVLSPVFWVRDFGTGMSHEQVMTRYTRLFNSTKDGSTAADYKASTPDGITREANKQVGQLGLGSKVFFSYTDACTLTVWQDGVKRVYSVFMGGDGVPQVALAGAIESDEPVGVKVEFAVKNKDLLEFGKAAARVYKGFPYVPIGVGPHTLSELSVEPLMIGTGWKAYPEDYLPDVPYYAKQGCVLYPIDLAQLDSTAVEDEDGNMVMSARFERYKTTQSTIIMDFPIGSINFDLSRERLAYDEITITALREGWDRFHADISATFASKFADIRSGYKLALAAHDNNASSFGPLFAVTPESAAIETVKEALGNAFPRYSADSKNAIFAECYGIDRSGKLTKYRDRRNQGAPEPHHMLGALYLYADGPLKHKIARLSSYMKKNEYKFAFVFGAKKLSLKNFRKLGEIPIFRMSEIPDIPKAEREKLARGGGGAFRRFKRFDGSGDFVAMDEEQVNDLDPEDTFYALINKGNLVREQEGARYCRSDVDTLNSILKPLKMGEVIAINTRITEPKDRWPVDEYPRWTTAITRILDNVTLDQLSEFATVFNFIQYENSIYETASVAIRTVTKRGNPITAMRRYRTRYKKLSKEKVKLWGIVIGSATNVGGWNGYLSDCYNTFDDLYFGLIELCREAKIELLLPMQRHHGRGSCQATNHRLLSKKWHRLAVAMTESSYETFKNFYYKSKLKEYNVPC